MLGMSSDVKWFIGIVLPAGLALAGLIIGCAGRIVRRLDSFDDRLRAVEVTQGRILERLGEPPAELAKNNPDNQ